MRIDRSAQLDRTGRYRWRLDRRWRPDRRRVLWIMLNPSTADGDVDDHTIGKCIGFTERWGYGQFAVTNLAPHRSTDPKRMREMIFEDGQDGRDWEFENRGWIWTAAAESQLIVAAWGAGAAGLLEEQGRDLLRELAPLYPIHCLGRTSTGFPRHPLMLPYTTKLELLQEPDKAAAR